MSKRAHEDDGSAAIAAANGAAGSNNATVAPVSVPPMSVSASPSHQQQQPPTRTKRQKKGNFFLTNEQRQALCIKAATDKFTQTQLCYWAKDEFGLSGPLNQSTVSRILSEKDKYIALEGSNLTQKRKTYVEHPQLEAALSHWLLVSSHNNQRLQGDLIKEKGRAFAQMLGIESKISFSNGWLTGFKKRHQTILSSVPGEGSASTGVNAATGAGSISVPFTAAPGGGNDPNIVDFGSWNLQHILQNYNPRDIFNVDETGLFFDMPPEKVLRRGVGKGNTRPAKAKLLLLLAVNADGSERLDPLFIGTSRHPPIAAPQNVAATPPKRKQQTQQQQQRSAEETGTTNPESQYNYSYSDKTWMNAIVFQKWLNTLNSQMKIESRHILLLMDDAPSHITRGLRLTNVRIVKLPSSSNATPTPTGTVPTTNTTMMPATVQQPMDTGITMAFKRRYRKRQMVHALDRHEAGETDIYSVDEVQAMKWCRLAWADIPKSLIVRCWLASNVFGRPMAPLEDEAQLDEAENALDMAIKEISYKLPLKRVMTLKEILSPPEEGENLHFVGTTDADFLAVGDDEVPVSQTSEGNGGDGVLPQSVPASVVSPETEDASQKQERRDVVVPAPVAAVTAVVPVDDTSRATVISNPERVEVAPQVATPPTPIGGSESKSVSSAISIRQEQQQPPPQQQQQQPPPQQQQQQQPPSQDPPVPDDDELLTYIQRIIPNLERLGCDERTIQCMREVRQTLKQKLAAAAKTKQQSEATTSLLI
ncbi:Ars binding protein 1, partial [Globisporangium splendens]